MTLNKILSYTYYLGMALVFVGILMHIGTLSTAYIVFGVGVIPVLGVRLYNRLICKKENQRLHSILVVSAIFLTLSCAAMFLEKNYWVVLLLITVLLDLYASFRRFK